jgi:hypothetical protein
MPHQREMGWSDTPAARQKIEKEQKTFKSPSRRRWAAPTLKEWAGIFPPAQE